MTRLLRELRSHQKSRYIMEPIGAFILPCCKRLITRGNHKVSAAAYFLAGNASQPPSMDLSRKHLRRHSNLDLPGNQRHVVGT